VLDLPQSGVALIFEPLTKTEREMLAKAGQIEAVPDSAKAAHIEVALRQNAQLETGRPACIERHNVAQGALIASLTLQIIRDQIKDRQSQELSDPDTSIENYGTIFLFRMNTPAGSEWVSPKQYVLTTDRNRDRLGGECMRSMAARRGVDNETSPRVTA
jgi:hypothetical protein